MTADAPFDAIVIGAGPAGLFCAARASERKRILLLEKNTSPGKKLLLSGSGRCNLTHSGPVEGFFDRYGDHGRFLRHALHAFTNADMVRYLHERGVDVIEEETGKIFPASGRARDILDALLRDLSSRGGILRTGEPALEVLPGGEVYTVNTGKGVHRARAVVIAAGGMSYPATGSSGDGYALARSLDIAVVTPRPALAPIRVRDYPFEDLAGISIRNADMALFRGGKKIRSGRGDVLFTHRSLSGPGILDLSRYANSDDRLSLGLAGYGTGEDPRSRLREIMEARPAGTVKRALSPLGIPERLAARLLELSGADSGIRCGNLPRETRRLLESMVAGFEFTVEGTGGYDEAMVTAGGVDLREINPRTMEAKARPGLYCIGETLDIDGDTGGYNIQACFSTAWLAARHIVESTGTEAE
jgi:predicted Rossmann fold flavoprotein